MYMWAREYPVKDAAEEAEVQEKTAIDVYQWLREVCSTRLIADGRVVLGGRGSIVQIDESLFRHKPKVVNMMAFTIPTLHLFLYYIASSRTGNNQGGVGFWNGGHISDTCIGVHANCTRSLSCNSPSHNTCSHCPTHHHSFRSVGSVQPSGNDSYNNPRSSQPLTSFCGSEHRCTYTERGIVLEQG